MHSLRTWWSRFFNSKPVPTHRRPAPRPHNRFRPCLEIMEHRLVPADVNATLSLGVLTLTSVMTTTDTSLTLSQATSGVPGVNVNNSTGNILIGGVSQGASHDFTGVHSIVFKLSGGDDSATLNGVTITGSLAFNGVTANSVGDKLFLQGGTKIGGSVSVTNGAATQNTAVNTVDINTSSFIGGNVTANLGSTGSQDGLFNIQAGSNVGGSVSVAGGAGTDTLSIGGSVGKSFTATLGAGNNSFSDTTGIIGGGLTISGTTGDDSVSITSFARIGTFVSASLGAGTNTVLVDGSVVGTSLTMVGTVGNDTLTVQASVTIGSFISANLGAGTNIVLVDGTSGRVSVGSSLTMISTAGNDKLLIGRTSIGTFVSANLGAGDDNVGLEHSDIGTFFSYNEGSATTGNVGAMLDCRVGTSVTITGNTDNDFVRLEDCLVGTFISAPLGSGDNGFLLRTCAIGGSVTASGTTGIDSFIIDFISTVGGAVSASLGADNDAFTVGGSTIHGAVTATMSDGNDLVHLSDDSFAKNVSLSLGNGANQMFLDADGSPTIGSTILGNLSITSGTAPDQILIGTLQPVLIGGTTTINTGLNPVGLGDVVEIEDTAFLSAVSIIFGGGDDTLNVEANFTNANGATSFAEKLTVNMGAGNDTADFGFIGDLTRKVSCRVACSLDGGTGTDTLFLKELGNYIVNGVLITGASPNSAIAEVGFENLF